MSTLNIRKKPEEHQGRVQLAETQIDFDSWIQISQQIDSELIRGVVTDRMAAQYPHEWIFTWLLITLGGYVQNQKLGKVLGSHSAVKISNHDGRLPHILFVRSENDHIIHKDAIYGAPDVVIEIVSENDRPGYLTQLENDYRSIEVAEIALIDPAKKVVRLVKKTEAEYDVTTLSTGPLKFTSIPGFRIEVDWLFADDRPDPFTVTKQLIEAAG